MNTKGAINLSINMIIVLIIAIIILGFALSFITGLFKQAGETIEGQFPAATVDATKDRPIGLPDEVFIEPGEKKNLAFQVMNTHSSQALSIDQSSMGGTSCTNVRISLQQVSPISIKPGETQEVRTVWNALQGAEDTICTVVIRDPSNQLIQQSFFVVTESRYVR